MPLTMDPAQLLARGRTRETAIVRDRFGRWFDGGVPITHRGVVASFDGWIDRAPDGRFCLSNGLNWAFVRIEGAPYRVLSVTLGEPLTLNLTGGRREPLDATTLRLGEDDSLWCDVRDGRVPARFDNHALLQLADLIGEDEGGTFLRLGDGLVRPVRVADPLAGWDPSKGHVEA